MFEYAQGVIGYEYDWTYIRLYVRTYASSTVSQHFGAKTKTTKIAECGPPWMHFLDQ